MTMLRPVWPAGETRCPLCKQDHDNLRDSVDDLGQHIVSCRNCWITFVVVATLHPARDRKERHRLGHLARGGLAESASS